MEAGGLTGAALALGGAGGTVAIGLGAYQHLPGNLLCSLSFPPNQHFGQDQ